MQNKIAILSAAFSTLLISACSTNPLTVSLSELGTATKSDIGSIGFKLIRSVNVTGLSATEVVGSYTIDPDPNFWNIPVPWGTKNIPDTLFPRVFPGCTTMVVESKFPDATHDDVIAVRDNLSQLNEKQQQHVNYKIQQVVLEEIQSSLNAETKNIIQEASAKDSKIKDEATLEEQINALKNAPPSEGTSKLEEKKQALDKLKSTRLDQARKATGLVDMESIDKGITSLSLQIKKLDNQISEAKNALDKALRIPSIVVTNWNRTERIQANASAVEGGVSAGMQKDKQMTGYLILGSPRVTTLIIGNDLLVKVNNLSNGNDKELSSLEHPERLYITQYDLSAKELAWTESRSGSFELRVNVQIDKVISALSQLPTNVKNSVTSKLGALKAEVGFGLASAYSASSTGSLGNATTAVYRFDFLNNYSDALLAEMSRASKYRSIYTSRGTLADLVKTQKKSTSNKSGACHNSNAEANLSYFEENLLDTGMGINLSSELITTDVRVRDQQVKTIQLLASLPKNSQSDKAKQLAENELGKAINSATTAISQCYSSVDTAEGKLINARSEFISQTKDSERRAFKRILETAKEDAKKISAEVKELENGTLDWLTKISEESQKDSTLKNVFNEGNFKSALTAFFEKNKLEGVKNCTAATK